MATVYILYTCNYKHIKPVLAELDFRAGIIIRAIESTVLRFRLVQSLIVELRTVIP